MIDKNICFRLWEDFSKKKLSANEANTQYYIIGNPGTILTGTPDIAYHSFVLIKDKEWAWSRGKLYKWSNDESIADINSALTYVERLNADSVISNERNYSSLPLLCGQPPILFGNGTPQEAIVPRNWNQYDPTTGKGYMWNGEPSALGQVYINIAATSNGRYTAVPGTDADGLNLRWVNF